MEDLQRRHALAYARGKHDLHEYSAADRAMLKRKELKKRQRVPRQEQLHNLRTCSSGRLGSLVVGVSPAKCFRSEDARVLSAAVCVCVCLAVCCSSFGCTFWVLTAVRLYKSVGIATLMQHLCIGRQVMKKRLGLWGIALRGS